MSFRMHKLRRLGLLPVAALVVAGGAVATPAQAAAGTTLSQTVSANAHLTKTFDWTIDKKADPTTLNLFRGDSSTANYTVTLTKDSGTVRGWIDGQVCITNGGAVATTGLASTINVTQPPSTNIIASTPLNLGTNTVLAAGQTYCYPYSVDIPSANLVPGGTYKVTAVTTITNHSGHSGAFGPSTSASVIMPMTATLVHDSVSVSDSLAGSLGTFSASATPTYSHIFSCDSDQGTTNNTASITYADDQTAGPSASASVTVNCYALGVSKTVNTSLTRTYTWHIAKSADVSSLALLTGQTTTVNYLVNVTSDFADSNWAATGQITVHNPAPIDAVINSVADAVGTVSATSVDCGQTFPYTLPAGGDLVCNYTVNLPDASGGTNTATATLQNHADGTASGTTDFSGTALVDFSNATINTVDATATLSDTYPGTSLPSTPVNASDTPLTYTYPRTVGPYSTPGNYTVDNTATVVGTDTGKSDSSSVSIPVTVTSGGCTLSAGYWKTHPDQITPLLPVWLGTPGGTASVEVTSSSQAVTILSIPDPSNGIDTLYAQLLTAKLSIENGADPSAVASTISAADAFLATHGSSSWSSLTTAEKNQVNDWQTALANYNTGVTGPGECSSN